MVHLKIANSLAILFYQKDLRLLVVMHFMIVIIYMENYIYRPH